MIRPRKNHAVIYLPPTVYDNIYEYIFFYYVDLFRPSEGETVNEFNPRNYILNVNYPVLNFFSEVMLSPSL